MALRSGRQQCVTVRYAVKGKISWGPSPPPHARTRSIPCRMTSSLPASAYGGAICFPGRSVADRSGKHPCPATL